MNREEWEKHDRRDTSVRRTKASRARAGLYFCEYGFHEQTQKRTPKINWAEFYGEKQKADPSGFHKTLEEFVVNAAIAATSTKLADKIKIASQSQYRYGSTEDQSVYDFTASSDDPDDASVASSHSEDSLDMPIHRGTNDSRKAPCPTQDGGVRDHNDVLSDEANHASDGTTPRKSQKRKRNPGSENPRTPKRHRIVKPGTPGSKSYRVYQPLEVTPLPSRTSQSAVEDNLTPHQLARQRLHVAEVPVSLPCREKEFAAIFKQVAEAIMENHSRLVYVCGTPGTGKTATVREIMKALQQKVDDEELFPFKFVEINGMKIADPTQAYSRLWETMTNQRVTPKHASELLKLQFAAHNKDRLPTVVLLDEIDQLTTTKQDVMYNFLEWPNRPNTRLIVIAVANTMDLPERLANKVESRLELTDRITFHAYTRTQLSTIIKSRLSSIDSIDVQDDAITFACMKVSAVSGDARRALDICRRAFELAEPGFQSVSTAIVGTPKKKTAKQSAVGRVDMEIMRRAIRDMESSPVQMYLKGLPFVSKIFLKALVACIRRTGLIESTLGNVIEDATRICKQNTHPDLSTIMGLLQPVNLLKTAEVLSESGIVILEDVRKGEKIAKVKLKVPESELLSSWAEDAALSTTT